MGSSASAAEVITNLRICEMLRTGPLSLGMGSSSDRKMWAPAQLREPVYVRKVASEWAARIIELA